MEQIITDISSPADFTERFINQTNRSVFLTGKAGTGKTTLLKKIIKTTHKKTVVLAPTGIAALNAGGVTIHSFFQMPFGIFIPEYKNPPFLGQTQVYTKNTLQRHFKLNKRKIELIRKLELLIIDEVSMLRADLLDAMDFMLQKIRRNSMSYGGVQILFIGDLMQLPPIIKSIEKNYINKYYKDGFFFQAQAVQNQPPLYIELDKIFRQHDEDFIQVLNELRNNSISKASIQLLNEYVKPSFNSTEHEGFITLTTHNHKAESINQKALEALPGKEISFKASISKKFPSSIFPIPENLHLKVGAQVMFIKNDTAYEKRYYNGKIGRVISLSNEEINVLFPEENKVINVEQYEWENKRFSLNEDTGEIEEKIIGAFTHYPLKLAWAITIHKSQGLTFEKAVLDIADVFTSGQAYVALSRLTSLEGLILKRSIATNEIKNNPSVIQYAQNKATTELLEKHLSYSTKQYIQHLLQRTFNWEALASEWTSLESLHKIAGENSEMNKNKNRVIQQAKMLMNTLTPAKKFRLQLLKICQAEKWDTELLYQRYEAAYHYFMKCFEPLFRATLKQIILLEQRSGTKQYIEKLIVLDEHLTSVIKRLKKSRNIVNCIHEGVEFTKDAIVDSQVTNFKIAKVQVVRDEIQAEFPQLSLNTSVTSKKESSHHITFRLHSDGLTIEDIAKERSIKEKTVYSHFSKLIQEGKLDSSDVLSPERMELLKEKIGTDIDSSLTQLKNNVGKNVSWEELKIYRSGLLQKKN